MKLLRLVLIVFTTWMLILMYVLCLSTGLICASYNGFAVDSNNYIYVGKNNTIEVQDGNGNKIREFSSVTDRGYKFTVNSNNEILLSTGDFLYTIDTEGNIKNKSEVHSYEDDLHGVTRTKFITSDGTVYKMRGLLLRTCIYRVDGNKKTVVFKMPMFDYAAKYVVGLSVIISLFFGGKYLSDKSKKVGNEKIVDGSVSS